MLLVQDNLLKLGGVKISGQMKNIEISQAATIENIEDDKGKTKATQPTGYEPAKITIEFILEASKHESEEEQMSKLQRLFKPYGQKKAKILKIVNEDCSARGISKVYFQSLSTQNVIAESGRTATLELLAPISAGIKTKKKGSSGKASGRGKYTGYRGTYVNKKTTKNSGKSPAAKIRSTKNYKTDVRIMLS